jgi:hypothetical protein
LLADVQARLFMQHCESYVGNECDFKYVQNADLNFTVLLKYLMLYQFKLYKIKVKAKND